MTLIFSEFSRPQSSACSLWFTHCNRSTQKPILTLSVPIKFSSSALISLNYIFIHLFNTTPHQVSSKSGHWLILSYLHDKKNDKMTSHTTIFGDNFWHSLFVWKRGINNKIRHTTLLQRPESELLYFLNERERFGDTCIFLALYVIGKIF